MNTKIRIAVVIFVSLSFSACGGGGSDGPDPAPPPPAPSGPPTSAVDTKIIPPGAECPNGGVEIEIGVDDNANGQLDTNEIDNTQIVCNGLDGNNALVNLTPTPPGNGCDSGGLTIESGADLNDNGSLDAAEVTVSEFICIGMSTPASIVDFSEEPAGANCANGGLRVDAGPDTNGNGALEAAEITTTNFVCNGTGGGNSLPTVPANTDYTIAVNQPFDGILLANDTDGDRLTFEISTPPSSGTLVDVNPLTGVFRYQPADNFSGGDAFGYRAFDGNVASAEGMIQFIIQPSPVTDSSIQLDSTALEFTDFPDGQASRTFSLEGVTSAGRLVASLPLPFAISGTNLAALADNNPDAQAPRATATLTRIPAGSGTVPVQLTVYQGSDNERVIGERKITVNYEYDWEGDGSTLSVTPSPAGSASATYFTVNGELAVQLALDNATANVFEVRDGNKLDFVVGGLFATDQLGPALDYPGPSNSFTPPSGSYFYELTFGDFPLVDSFGQSVDMLQGQFHISQQPVPLAVNGSRFLLVAQGQLTQNSASLDAFGGTGPLAFSLTNTGIPGTAVLTDSALGEAIYVPSPNILIDDALLFQVSDGVLESNSARFRFDIRDTEVSSSGDASLVLNARLGEAVITWLDAWDDETGFRIDAYDQSCECWQSVDTFDTGANPGIWRDMPTQSTFYRVVVLRPGGDEVIRPGALAANVDGVPEISVTLAESSSGSEVIQLGLDATLPVVRRASWFVDLDAVQGCSNIQNWPNFACQRSTSFLSAGTHQAAVELSYQRNSTVLVTTEFSVEPAGSSPRIALERRIVTGSPDPFFTPPDGSFEIRARTTNVPIDEIAMDFVFEGVPLVRLTEPNGYYQATVELCDAQPLNPPCRDGRDAFVWRVFPDLPGTYLFSLTATADDGRTETVETALRIPYSISVDPLSPDPVTRTVVVSGAVENTNYPVTVTITIGDLPAVVQPGPEFSATLDFTGLPTGTYPVTIRAQEQVSLSAAKVVTMNVAVHD